MIATDTIVCLHHYFLGGWCWHPMTAHLGRWGYALRVPDLPGHHRSTDTEPEPSLDELANQVWQRLDLPPEQRVHLFGHGFGSLLAQHMARQQPDRVQSLILANSISHAARTGIFGRQLASKPTPAINRLAKDMRKLCLGKQWRQRIEDSVLEFHAQPHLVDHYWQLQQQFDSRDWLSELTMPCLLLQTKDQALSGLQQGLADAQVQQLLGTGFWFMLEAPEATALSLKTFLDGLWQNQVD